MSTAEQAKESQKQRFEFLRMLYELTEETKDRNIKIWWVQLFLYTRKSVRLEESEVRRIVDYLSRRGLVEVRRPPETWVKFESQYISMTPDGVDAVEKALLHPDTPTKDFPSVNILVVGEMRDSQIQQASPASTQALVSEGEYHRLQQLVESLRESMDILGIGSQEKSDLRAEMKTIEIQTARPKPSREILTRCVHSIIRILESAARTAIATVLLELFKGLLKG